MSDMCSADVCHVSAMSPQCQTHGRTWEFRATPRRLEICPRQHADHRERRVEIVSTREPEALHHTDAITMTKRITYDGCIEQWKVDLAMSRIRAFHFTKDQWPDLMQELSLRIVRF